MKLIIFMMSLIVATIATEYEQQYEPKKRGVPKSSPNNAIPNSGHKVETAVYNNNNNYQQQQQIVQQQPAIHQPSYPVASQNYHQPETTQHAQPAYNIVPQAQIIPLQFIPQTGSSPKFELIASKNPAGQMQLALIPHSVFMNLVYGTTGLLPQPSLTNNHVVQNTPVSTKATMTPNYNNYVTPPTYAPQPASSQVYPNQQVPLSLNYNNPPHQQQATYLYSQNPPQYYNSYSSPPSNQVYSQSGQQLLTYYQTNPQAKYQLLYGGSEQEQVVPNYQPQVLASEYEKVAQPPAHHNVALRSPSDLSTAGANEYITPPDTHFRPIHSFGRNLGGYKL